MIDIRTGKEMSRRSALKGLAAIIAAGAAPSLCGSITRGIGYRNLAGRMAAMGDSVRTVERLISFQGAYILTGYSLNTLNFKIETSGGCRTGYMHNMVPGGTWIAFNSNALYYKDFSTKYDFSRDDEASYIYDSRVGLYKNGSLIKGFTCSYGIDIITTQQLSVFGIYDFYINSYSSTNGYNCKKYKLWLNGTKVRDCIPVVKNNEAFLYDSVDNVFLGNSGSGKIGWKEFDGTIVQPT